MISLHDNPLDRIDFDFTNQTIRIYYSISDDKDGYYLKVLTFDKVDNMSLPHFNIGEFDDLEIYNVDIEKDNEGRNWAEFTFLKASNSPSWHLKFSFDHFKDEDYIAPLSPE